MSSLAVFDFDHTICLENTDIVAANMISPDLIPKSVKDLHRKEGWTSYMDAIFDLLYKNGIDETTIARVIEEIPPLNGIPELIRQLKYCCNSEIIIISDSNSFFIEKWLNFNRLTDCISNVFTNPAKFVNGQLRINMYHYQETCDLSTRNLCKGLVLQQFLDSQRTVGITYEKVIYVGDGRNDFCPILKLRTQDLACARKGFKCADMLNNVLKGEPLEDAQQQYTINAKVVYFLDGVDLFNMIKLFLHS